MKTTVNIHLLLTAQKDAALWTTTSGQLIHTHVSKEYKEKYKPQHMYFTIPQYGLEISDIKDGDWVLNPHDPTGKIVQANKSNLESIKEWWAKIIATTDTSLNIRETIFENDVIKKEIINKKLPSIPESFITYFTEQYNKDNVLKTTEVELLATSKSIDINQFDIYYELKLTSNNEVIVSLQKDTSIETAARLYAGFDVNTNPNDYDERYYRTHDCEKYDAFLAGAEWFKKNLYNNNLK